MKLRHRAMWLVACSSLALACAASDSAPIRPNVLLILMDTLRADHIGAYGYERDTSPTIDDLARNGLRFQRTIAQASWTLPSLMSLFTGRHPPLVATDLTDFRQTIALHDDETTLAEHLRKSGYRTLSIATNPYNVDKIFNLMQGFDVKIFESSAPASWVIDHAVEQLDAHVGAADGRPFFLYLHLMDTHTPYAPPPPYDSQFSSGEPLPEHANPTGVRSETDLDSSDFRHKREQTLALYDGALRFADSQIGRLLEHLDSMGLRESTIVAIASDHGEAFWDHVALERENALHTHGEQAAFGFGHGHTVFRELIEVPLILNGPGIDPDAKQTIARNLDILPTLLALSGLPHRQLNGDGVSLVGGTPPTTALSETRLGGRPQSSLVTPTRQISRVGRVGLVFDATRPQWPELDAPATERARLETLLREQLSTVRRARATEGYIDAETAEALRELGYIE